MSLVRACSSGDYVSLYQQTWETRSLLSFSVQSTLCRQALLLQARCPDIWCSNLPPGRSCDPLTKGLKIPWSVLWVPWARSLWKHPRSLQDSPQDLRTSGEWNTTSARRQVRTPDVWAPSLQEESLWVESTLTTETQERAFLQDLLIEANIIT